MWSCRRVRLLEWKQCPLGAWLDVDQLGSKGANSAQAYDYFSSDNRNLAEHSYCSSKTSQFSRKLFPLISPAQTSFSRCPQNSIFWWAQGPEASLIDKFWRVLGMQQLSGLESTMKFMCFPCCQIVRVGGGLVPCLMARWHLYGTSNYFELTLYDSELLCHCAATALEPCQWLQLSFASQLDNQLFLLSLGHGQFAYICLGVLHPMILSALPALLYWRCIMWCFISNVLILQYQASSYVLMFKNDHRISLQLINDSQQLPNYKKILYYNCFCLTTIITSLVDLSQEKDLVLNALHIWKNLNPTSLKGR